VSFHHSCTSDHSPISCMPCQVVPSLQPLAGTIFLAVISATANATVPYNYWHHRWVFILLVLLITHAFLARLAKWSHPCNRWQVLSFWQWFPPLPTLPSLIRVGTVGEFSSFLCFWSLTHFLHALPSDPILATIDRYYLSGSDFRHCQHYRPL